MENAVITNLIEVELCSRRVRRHFDLCDVRSRFQGEKKEWIPRGDRRRHLRRVSQTRVDWISQARPGVCNDKVSATRVGGKTRNTYWARTGWFVVLGSRG